MGCRRPRRNGMTRLLRSRLVFLDALENSTECRPSRLNTGGRWVRVTIPTDHVGPGDLPGSALRGGDWHCVI